MKILSSVERKKGRGEKSPPSLSDKRRLRLDLFAAIEQTDDGTSRDETLRHFADELLRLGLVMSDELFISSYDIVHDREQFFFAGRRGRR